MESPGHYMRPRILLRPLVLLTAIGLAASLSPAVEPASAQESVAPRLLVVVVVDQFRADYLSQFDDRWRGGLRTLLDEGAVFERAAYPYMNTSTCAGHTTIGTGALPRTHGMVLNSWWHRAERSAFPCMDDPEAPNLSYGRPSEAGNSAQRILVNTLADELRVQRSGTQVVSLSLTARAAIGLAGHGGDAVTWFDNDAGSFVTSTAFATELVPVIQAFVASDPLERDLGRTWTLRDPPGTYRSPDAGIGERPPSGRDGRFPHAVDGEEGAADARSFALWRQSPWSDAYLQRMAAATIDDLALGQRDAIDFLGIGFSALDLVGHRFGPNSREVEDVLLRLDDTLGALISHLDATVGRARYVLALTADHGVAPIPVPGVTGRVASDDVRERIEDVLELEWGPRAEAPYVDAVRETNLYFAPDVFEWIRERPSVARAVERAVLTVPGMARLLWSDELSDASPDPLVRAAALSYMPSRSGDLILVPQPYWIIAGRNSTLGTSHGTAAWYDQRVALILLGGTVRPGRFADPATPADIAPTLADLAGIRLSSAEGRILREALQ